MQSFSLTLETRGVSLRWLGLFYGALSFELLKVSAGVHSITLLLLLSDTLPWVSGVSWWPEAHHKCQ